MGELDVTELEHKVESVAGFQEVDVEEDEVPEELIVYYEDIKRRLEVIEA